MQDSEAVCCATIQGCTMYSNLGGQGHVTYIGAEAGMPILPFSRHGNSLTADNVDERQTDGVAKSSSQLLVDLLLVSDGEECASCSEADDGRP